MPYRAPVEDFEFLLKHVAGFPAVQATARFAEAGDDVVRAILGEAGRLCAEVLAPLQRAGDLYPARLENGVVRTPPGFAEGYAAIRAGGWTGMLARPDSGGLGLPLALTTCVNEMMSAACLSLQLNPLMTQGQIEALEHHASAELKARFLPRLVSGEWAGTMNLTEPQAGSDVGALTTRAVPNGDGSYAITGQKIFITWGDSDVTENICHLVLARLPEGAPGTKGISLFLVPKFLPDAEGRPGVRNALRAVSLEHKLGLHGSPTAVMAYEGATGWLVGEAHDGMRAMFTMMNNARLGVGVQGIGQAEGAFQLAVAYAMTRKQGRTPGGSGTIVDHADVRRMLAEMRAEVTAARGIALMTAVALDLAAAGAEGDWAARAAFLTPIAKAFGTDTGIRVAEAGVQVHGGMGFIEETGAAQFSRDVRVTAIYEGTNGIQALDLVGRKLADGGAAAFALLDEVEAEAEPALLAAAQALRQATATLLAMGPDDRAAGATAYLAAFARVLGGHVHWRSARAEGTGRRTRLAEFYLRRRLPEVAGLLAQATAGAAALRAVTAEDLAA